MNYYCGYCHKTPCVCDPGILSDRGTPTIDQRIEAQLMKHIDWFVKNMPPFPPPWATRTLRNLLKQLDDASAIRSIK